MIAEMLSNLASMVSPQRATRDGWHSYPVGSVSTKSGATINPYTAENYSSVWRATRVLSDGIASLPLNLRRNIDDRNTETAYSHHLHRIMHDAPNKEQNSYSFFDMQVPLQVNWGNCYAEIQRDLNGDIIGLWPIHPSRIPVTNIVRGPFRGPRGVTVGGEGELVYLVKNDDGSVSPIPRREMFHVPGVMSGNGIAGKGTVQCAAETLGIITATEDFVGAFFKNGAATDIVITIPKEVPKEERQNLRASWKAMHQGAKNAHNMLLLIGDSKVSSLGVNPDEAQLLESRRFGIEEVSRFWGVPKHFLSSLENANYNSLELLNQSFLIYSLMPWVIRWEKALNQQLLSPEEQGEFFFKFNLNGLMRGDSAARSSYYQRMFDMGVLSINEIRELEDLNAIDGGDRYFILANNRVPLDRIDDISLLNQGKAKEAPSKDSAEQPVSTPSEVEMSTDEMRGMVQESLHDAISGMVVYETNRIRRASENRREFFGKVQEFYSNGKFRTLFEDSIRGALGRANKLGSREEPGSLVERHITQSFTELMAIQDQPTLRFTESVQAVLESWKQRAAIESQVFSNQGAQS